jgi:tetratricopeptide (TPR) repeat protein
MDNFNAKQMKMKYFIGLMMVLLSLTSTAQDFSSKLLKAQDLYARSQYDSAALIYQSIIDGGYQSPELYYNLGNSYFKLDEIPSAILYFEKAARLNPNDENIQHNLQLCNSMIPDRIDQLPQLFFIRWYVSLYNYFPIDTWASIIIVLMGIFSVFFLIFLLSERILLKKLGFWSAVLFLLLTMFSLFLTYQKYSSFKQHNDAIIFTPSITVKSSPTQNSVDLFVLHEGTKVTILDTVSGWKKVKIQNGSVGWIEGDKLEII